MIWMRASALASAWGPGGGAAKSMGKRPESKMGRNPSRGAHMDVVESCLASATCQEGATMHRSPAAEGWPGGRSTGGGGVDAAQGARGSRRRAHRLDSEGARERERIQVRRGRGGGVA